MNGQTFVPGDSILFKRGDVWNESLAPGSSGSSGNPITFDAYGTGAAPNLSGYYAVPSTAWVLVTGHAWKAPLPATYSTINFCLFGSIWGQKVAASTANLTAQWDFYLANGFVYVYSVGSPSTFYNEPIVPMALSNVPVINVNGQSWLTFQHILVNWFDQYGIYVQGMSDHLVFANMEADSMIPQGTQPLGFYVDESAPGPGDIKIYNSEAHLNYDGFRFDGAATAITMVNDKAYANRDGALVDNTGAVTYSYCHFYASSLAVAGSTDVEFTSGSGPTAGAGNIAADTAPAVQVWQRYPAEVTLTVDDAGMTAGADTYYASTVLPIADAAGVPVGAAITVGYPLAQTLVSEFQGWVTAGRDVTSHSMSHSYYTNTDALEIQYTGSGTAAAMSISGKALTISVTGASDSVSYNLAQGQAQGTIKALRLALLATGKFTATEIPTCQGPYGTGCSAYTEAALLAQDLADVSGQDVKSSVYHMQLDVTRLTTDEITLSRQWMATNLTGLPATAVYVYPGGYETTTMQGITAGVPYLGARGALKEDLGVKDTYSSGFDLQNITSFGVNPSWQGLPAAALNQKVQALVWKQRVWGVPWGIFWHVSELSSTEITNLIQDFKLSGATVRTNTGLVNWLRGGMQESGTDGNSYYKLAATSTTLNFLPTKNSPVVDAGQNLGAAYALDLNGANQNSYGSGWEIGAHAYAGFAVYGGGAGGGAFVIGESVAPNTPQLPQIWVDNNEGTDGLVYAPPQCELNLGTQTWLSGQPTGCTFHVPYWTVGSPTFAGLQSAVNDDEACRTAQNRCSILDIPPGLYTTSSANGLVIPQTNTVSATCFNVLRSTQDSSLANGVIVCAHGMQDNLATSGDIGIENADCAGDALSYQLGSTVTAIPAGAFTLANGNVSNTSNYNDVSHMWTVESSGVNPSAVSLCNASGTGSAPICGTNVGPDHWLIEDMEARMAAGNTGNNYIVNIPDIPTLASQQSSHIHFRKDWVHGDWPNTVAGLALGANSISSAFNLSSCNYCSVVDSQVSMILRPGAEAHSIIANGTTFKFDHNWLEGGAETILSGGYGIAPGITGWVPFQDVEIRRNRLTYPNAWLGQSPVAAGTNPHWPGTFALLRKNGLEAKEGRRILEVGNIVENIDNSGSQNGPYFDLDVWNASGGNPGPNYNAIISDVTFQNNLARNSCEGFEIDGLSRNVGGVGLEAKNFVIANNLFYGTSHSNAGCATATNSGIFFESAQNLWQGTVTQTTNIVATFTANCSVFLGGCVHQLTGGSTITGGTGCLPASGHGTLTIPAPNISTGMQATGTYTCSGGTLSTVAITQVGAGYTSAPTATLPGGNGSGTALLAINNSSTAPGVGFQQLDLTAGQPVYVLSCPNPAFNASTITKAGTLFPAGLGPLAITGTNPASLSVSYPWVGTAGASDSSGDCTIGNFQAGPQNVQFKHNTFITDNLHALTSANDTNIGPNYQYQADYKDSIITSGGWFNNALGEGCATIQWNFDINSLTNDHLVFPDRTSTQVATYSGCAYGNNPNDVTGSPMMYFPATSYCAGATSTSACVGFVGAMNASAMPLTLPDYHSFALRSDSSFYAGNAQAASDGASMGPNIPAIDAAQTQNTYSCTSACGTPGPFPD